MNSQKEIALDALEIGRKGTIIRIDIIGPARKRIAEMGLSKGTEVEMIRKAPMNDPIEFRVRGYFVSLRKNDASLIRVQLKGEEAWSTQ
jgi:ferrous iron transport protein A